MQLRFQEDLKPHGLAVDTIKAQSPILPTGKIAKTGPQHFACPVNLVLTYVLVRSTTRPTRDYCFRKTCYAGGLHIQATSALTVASMVIIP